jgi:hypothetical protein
MFMESPSPCKLVFIRLESRLSNEFTPRFLLGYVLLIFLVFCVVLLCVFTFWVPRCDARYNFRIKRCSVRLYLQLFVGGSSLINVICVCGVQHILCCVFLRLVYPMLPVSLDCPFLIASSVFSNVYLVRTTRLWNDFHQVHSYSKD